MKLVITSLALLLASVLPSEARQLKLDISDGRVTLDAVNVPAQQILAEWARVGGTKVVGAEKITGAPLTLKLTDLNERQALDIILRNVAGFIAAPRSAAASPGASAYDRILIMATSTVAAAPANTRNGGRPGSPNAADRRMPPRPPQMPVPDEAPPEFVEEQMEEPPVNMGDAAPVFSFPNPQGAASPVFVPVPPDQNNGQTAQPVITLQPGQNGPTIYNFVPNMPSGAPGMATPPTGFTVFGSPTPGMIQVPQPPAQGQTPPPAPPVRPPGD